MARHRRKRSERKVGGEVGRAVYETVRLAPDGATRRDVVKVTGMDEERVGFALTLLTMAGRIYPSVRQETRRRRASCYRATLPARKVTWRGRTVAL